MEYEKLELLVKRASAGNEDAFEQLITFKSRNILYGSLEYLNDFHDAQDVAQEVVLKIYKNIRRLKNPKLFNAWLNKIILNECRAFSNKKIKRKEEVDIADYIEHIKEDKMEFLPQEFAEKDELRTQLLDVINGLPKKRKHAIIMYYYQGMDQNEIAYAMGTSISTVSSSILRAKKTIKEELEKRTGKIIDENVSKNKKITPLVISQALLTDSTNKISDVYISEFVKSSLSYVKNNAAAASISKAGSNILTKKIVALIIAGSLLVGSISAITINNVTKSKVIPRENTLHQTGEGIGQNIDTEIVFQNEDCQCGHLNPFSADIYFNGTEKVKSVKWYISKNNVIIYSGSGKKVIEPFTRLTESKSEGNYTIKYEGNDNEGNTIISSRNFEIKKVDTQNILND